MSDDVINDKEYLASSGFRTLFPPKEIVIGALSACVARSCSGGVARRTLVEHFNKDGMGEAEFQAELSKDYVFVSLQALAPAFQRLGHDIRPAMADFDCELTHHVLTAIDELSASPRSPLESIIEVEGQTGFFVSRDRLASIGVEPDIRQSWEARTSSAKGIDNASASRA